MLVCVNLPNDAWYILVSVFESMYACLVLKCTELLRKTKALFSVKHPTIRGRGDMSLFQFRVHGSRNCLGPMWLCINHLISPTSIM